MRGSIILLAALCAINTVFAGTTSGYGLGLWGSEPRDLVGDVSDLDATDSDDDEFKRQKWMSNEPVNDAIIVFEKVTPNEWVQQRDDLIIAVYTELSNSDPNVDNPTVVLKRIGRNNFIQITTVGVASSGVDLSTIDTSFAVGTWTKPDVEESSLADLSADLDFDQVTDDVSLDIAPVALFDSDSNMPLGDKVKKVCKETCESKNLLWSGQWSTKDGKNVETCKCQDSKVVVGGSQYVDVVPQDDPSTRSIPSLDRRARRVCPPACARRGLIWTGIYTTLDFITIFSCRCVGGPVIIG